MYNTYWGVNNLWAYVGCTQLWMLCMYELIVDVWLYIFNSQELSSEGHINMLVTANTLPVTGSLPVTSNWLPVTVYQWAACPSLVSQKGLSLVSPCKPLCSSAMRLPTLIFLSTKVVAAQRKGGHRRNLATQPVETYPPSRASFV
jgi:hypothetical protein